jgi:hypothetical protein
VRGRVGQKGEFRYIPRVMSAPVHLQAYAELIDRVRPSRLGIEGERGLWRCALSVDASARLNARFGARAMLVTGLVTGLVPVAAGLALLPITETLFCAEVTGPRGA